jgi:hydrogenase-4 component F
VPASAGLLLAGFFAITGSPPFGLFLSELTILQATFGAGRFVEGALFLLFLAIAFLGMGATVVKLVQGTPPVAQQGRRYREPLLTVLPPACFLLLVLILGIWIPAPLSDALHAAAAFVEVR